MDANELREMIEKGPPDGNELAVERITVTMPWLLFKVSLEGILAEGFSSFSDYIQGLIRDDKIRRDERGTMFSEPASPRVEERPHTRRTKLGFLKDAATEMSG
jgi:hypothetical protein